MSRVRYLALSLALAAPLAARAVDAPHDAGTSCSNCHMGHNSPGGSMTKTLGNANLCQSCHILESGFGFPWGDTDQAVPGTSGQSHSWSARATNLGATAPAAGTPMGNRLDGGNLQCSTCHDEHQSDVLIGSPADPANLGTQHVSAVTFSSAALPAPTGRMTLAAGSPAAGATAKFYRVEVVAGGTEANATFRLSNDKGVSWFGCTTPTSYSYVAYVASPSNACRVGASVALNDGTKVTVAFGAGTYSAGDHFDFYVSYPFLRVANKDAAMCLECHKDRNMTWQNAEGVGPIAGTGGSVVFGTTKFSHPVGQALNQGGRANGVAAILDANGTPGANGDGNATNDLTLGTGGVVTCLSCHRPHNADSNSLSVDPR